MTDLAGKVVLITGASGGIGRCAAEQFAAAGADVALLARGEQGLHDAAEGVRAHGREALVVAADVTDADSVEAAVRETVDRLGGLDILVTCAAATVHGPFGEIAAQDFDRVVEVTFTGVVNAVRAALPELERSDGTVVAVGSLAGKAPLPTFSSYSAAKHAQRGFLNSLRLELRAQHSRVRITQLHPGLVDTPLWDHTSRELPRRPPEGYDPAQVAAAILDLVHHPRPEETFGGEAKFVELLWNVARPIGDITLILLHHYFRTGTRGEPGTDVLDESVGTAGSTPTLPVRRPSLTRPVTRLLDRALH
jgi:NAD(P)-dependent dehydrogenase (short-subunit alcohol dehydrogenase family)